MTTTLHLRIFVLTLCLASFLSAQSADEKKAKIDEHSSKTLQMLYKTYPQSRKKVQQSYGYATFSNIGVNILFFSAAGGSGVAVTQSGKKTYMKMASAGVGPGTGIKDFRIVFLFENKKIFDHFVKHGWEANVQADAAAKSDNKGGSIEKAVTVRPGMKLYKMTKNGVAIQATIQGTKYWKNDSLNEK